MMRQFRRLPKAQDEMIASWVLGGPEAIGRHSTRTVDSLMKKGYIDSDGPTKKALDYVEARHREVVGFNPAKTVRPKYTYKDFVTGKLRFTRGKFLGWFPGDFAGVEIRYAGFASSTTGLFIPEYSLTPETRAMLAKSGKD